MYTLLKLQAEFPKLLLSSSLFHSLTLHQFKPVKLFNCVPVTQFCFINSMFYFALVACLHPIRDQTHAPAMEAQSPSYWTARKFPVT